MKAVVCLALCQEIIKRRMVGVTPLVVYRVYIIKKCRDMKPLRAAQQGGHALLFNGVLIVIDTVQRKTFLCERDSSHYAPELVQPFLRGKRMKQQGRQQRRRVVIRLHEILHRKNVEPPQRGQREIRRIGLIFAIAVPHVFDQIRRAAERRVLRRIAQEAFQRRVFRQNVREGVDGQFLRRLPVRKRQHVRLKVCLRHHCRRFRHSFRCGQILAQHTAVRREPVSGRFRQDPRPICILHGKRAAFAGDPAARIAARENCKARADLRAVLRFQFRSQIRVHRARVPRPAGAGVVVVKIVVQVADDHGLSVFFKRTAHAKTRQNDVVVATRIFLGDRRVIQDGLAPGQGKHGRGRDRERRPLLRLLFLTCNCIRGFSCGWGGFRLCLHRLRFRLDGLRCGLRGAASQKQADAQQQEQGCLLHSSLLSGC